VIDQNMSPPAQIVTVEAGKQPSGMVINQAGTLALVANRIGLCVIRWLSGSPGVEPRRGRVT
jgi:hypothetical protein